MKAVLLFVGCLALSSAAVAQEGNPIQWALSASTPQSLPMRKNAAVTARLHVSIAPGWHIYSLHQEKGGPIAMIVNVSPHQPLAVSGDIDAPLPKSTADPAFGVTTYFYTGDVDVAIPLRTTRKLSGTVALDVRYQACNREICLRPAVEHLTAPITKSPEEK